MKPRKTQKRVERPREAARERQAQKAVEQHRRMVREYNRGRGHGFGYAIEELVGELSRPSDEDPMGDSGVRLGVVFAIETIAAKWRQSLGFDLRMLREWDHDHAVKEEARSK